MHAPDGLAGLRAMLAALPGRQSDTDAVWTDGAVGLGWRGHAVCNADDDGSPNQVSGSEPYRMALPAYTAYGLHIRSEVPVPFRPASPNEEPDVTIRIGSTPDTLTGSVTERGVWQAAPGIFLLNVDGIARYLVTEGREIVVEPAGGSEAAVTTFPLGPVMAACLQQRGIVALHASGIETGAGAVLFAGASGSGKSALAAVLVARGYNLLADDVTGIVAGAGGRPTALPTFPAVRLWADTVGKLAWRERTQGRVRDELEKYLVPLEHFRAAPLAVRAVFGLGSHNRAGFEVASIPPSAAFALLLGFTYGADYLRELGGQTGHFRTVTQMARHVPFREVTRPGHPFLLDALADEIERCLEAGPLAVRTRSAAAMA